MARAVDFEGSNKVIHAPPGREDVNDLHTFVNGTAIVSAWQLDPDELKEVTRTGRVFLSSLSGLTLFPVFVGSETEVRRMVADYGKVWGRTPGERRAICANPLCAAAATHFPVIHFGPAKHPGPLPYKLEAPKGLCLGCQPGFDPAAFFADEAKADMGKMIVANGMPQPDFDRLELEWLPIDHPHFAEIAGGGEARLWFR